jgi:hypothetical protein
MNGGNGNQAASLEKGFFNFLAVWLRKNEK